MLKWRQTSIRLASSFTVRSFGICGSVGPPGAAPIEVRVLHFSIRNIGDNPSICVFWYLPVRRVFSPLDLACSAQFRLERASLAIFHVTLNAVCI